MRIAYLFSFIILSGCTDLSEADPMAAGVESKSPETAELPSLITYKKRVAAPNEVLVPPTLRRLTGILKIQHSCLVLESERGRVALVFEKGLASFDPTSRNLTVGESVVTPGDIISVGGPFNQPSEDFDERRVQACCETEGVWLVTADDFMLEN